MKRRWLGSAVSAAVAGLLLSMTAFGQDTEHGKALYTKWCEGCHGAEGAGDGPAADRMLPRPRDFTSGSYQVRTTASGELPTDDDLVRVVENGMPGTAMPAWKTKFSRSEIADLVAYVKTFDPDFSRSTPQPLEFGKPPGRSEAAIAEGREFYKKIECFKCHGQTGRGDGPSAPTLKDDWDHPIRAADLTENWTFNGGGTVEDIYRRLRTGLLGTPMPSFSDLLDAGFMTEEQLWHLAWYVRSLSPDNPPRVRDVIQAARIEGDLPASPDDSAWAAVETFYVPLVGQVVQEPRWFTPMVHGLFVKALHNGRELALRVAWDDPSRSPSPKWREWQDRIVAATYPPDDSVVEGLPDRLAVQFPATPSTGRERPYFLMGDGRRPVYLWSWSSEPERAVEGSARGLDTMQPLPSADQGLSASASYQDGEWRLEMRRSLTASDTAAAPSFAVGEPIPVAFFAWDGSNLEYGKRMAVSSWYAIYLQQPTSATVYISPVIAILVTAGLALLVVWRAQRREANSALNS